tara:strand:+ start:1212 stop:1754 length:543 start_codon:yes stop_codon:yes gene_type:complete
MTERWARFDTESNAIDNLEKTAHFLRTVKDNHEDWKWVVICIFSSLYGFAIQVAKGSDDLSVVNTTKKGHSRLITFDEALEACRVTVGGRNALVTSEAENESISTIQKEFRNKFEHFNPGSWSIEVSGFPDHILNILNVIRSLALDLNFYSHINEVQKSNLVYILDECAFIATKLREMYA